LLVLNGNVSFPQQSPAADSVILVHKINGAKKIRAEHFLRQQIPRHLMSAYTHHTDAPTCCAFCVKALPIVNGELQPWRAASGLFFCNEFCADDAEEASFQSHHRADRRANELPACAST
jgi:hypothetical protein